MKINHVEIVGEGCGGEGRRPTLELRYGTVVVRQTCILERWNVRQAWWWEGVVKFIGKRGHLFQGTHLDRC